MIFRKLKRQLLPISILALGFGFTGCLTDDDDDNGDQLTTRDVELGAQGNTSLGSSLDADDMTPYLIADAVERAADIDLIFAYSTEQDVSAIYSPNVAKEGIEGVSEGFPFLAALTPARETPIRNISASQWESVTTEEGLQVAWDAGTQQENGRLAVTAGQVFMIQTSEDRLVMIRVDSIDQGAAGETTLSGRSRF